MRTVTAAALLLASLLGAACAGSSTPGGGAATAPGAPAVFASAPPYASSRPAVSAVAAHAAKGAPVPTGTPCLSCHKSGGAPAFTFAGSVYTDDARAAPNPDAEISVLDASGKERIAHADADGNFWVKGDALALPAHAGARQGAKVVKMGGAVDNADCNGCHDAKFPVALTPPKP